MRSRVIVSLAVLGALLAAPGAWAATVSVDDDGKDCPAAPFASIQAAIDAAAPGDTVAVCTGTYVEGTGAAGSNALTVGKDLAIKGMGADRVRIQARRSTPTGGEIGTTPADLLDGRGDLVAVNGTPGRVLTVDLSGVTLDGNGVVVEAGVVYRDAQGTVSKSRITNVVTSEAADAFGTPGGWRNPAQPGIGVAQVTAASPAPPGAVPRSLTVENTRIDRYNAAGILLEGGGSGLDQRGVVIASEVVGRVLCQNFAANGDCSAPGLVTTGPLFGQDGVRVTNRAAATIRSSMVTQNLVNGEGAPVRQTWSANGETQTNPGTAGNANLRRAAGIRLVDADVAGSLITRTNIVDNAYGVLNVAADGTTASPEVVQAPDNWWGLRFTPLPPGSATPNPGPAVDPVFNPPVPENPVNAAVNFIPYRSGPQSDPRTGQFSNIQAPNTDASPIATLTAAPGGVRRGERVTLTATAEDDFGIRRVTFYDGSTVVGTDTAPPYATTVPVPADAPCAERAYTVVVEDAIGQTSSATASVGVVGCPAGPPSGPPAGPPSGPPAGTPSPPSVTIPASLREIGQGGVNVPVTASSPAGIARVEWFLGDRRVCVDTASPFTCRLVPRITEVGTQSLRVVVTGNDGLTTTVARQIQVPRFRARGLAVSIKKTRTSRGRLVRRVTVTLLRPAGTAARDACVNSTMTMVVNRRYRGFVNQVRRLRSNCTVSLSFTDRRATRRIYSISARFGGNTVLRPAVKYRRFS